MITKDNFKDLLTLLKFTSEGTIYTKHFPLHDAFLKVDFQKAELIFPEDKGLIINERQTCNLSSDENFVVFECVNRLLEKGYKPQHIELEPKWKVGHGASGGRADILIKDHADKALLIIECKTQGKEFNKAWKETLLDGDQLFSYAQQISATQFLCLYTSDFDNKTLSFTSNIVSHRDNEKILEDDNTLKAFKNAENVKDRYRVWRDTYKLEYTTQGIFEDNIPSYNIGKDKYAIADLASVSSRDLSKEEGKYHKFATILRQHNVSGKENAFDTLVNLFLCKIVDEQQNPNDLKFYWKGIAYDSYFDLQDRLQELYKEGMGQFLNEKITYVNNKMIDDAFWAVKQQPNATKNQIKKYFRELKFFNKNDFGFIDVHNEKLFYQNAAVLLKVVQMFQDVRLKTDIPNQFLGDLFEGFLDQGIKQSEGQFFTPMPITRFLLMCLPLENLIKTSTHPPKAIDYACGAGHFLNELASQITPFVDKNTQSSVKEYYKNIYGIEKEYRLSKVAKVSAFMYGQDEINIIYGDALVEHPEIQNDSFSILVANPPFSVKGFLETLDESQREAFELSQTIDDKSIPNNNSIETFFLERAKQLLKGDGVAAIIVPSSVLSNADSTYVRTREIILQSFDIVAITEFGSGTFGKTGTNTVGLFLKRKNQQPQPAEQYLNRVNNWFDDWANETATQAGVYEDLDFVKKYCQHINVNFEDYCTLLAAQPSEELLKTEIFEEYHKDFYQSTEVKNIKAKKQFKDKNPKQQTEELDKRFLKYLQNIEKNKLYYFVLASTNAQQVLVVKNPADGKEQKQFLGYEWSNAKGNEGIKLTKDSHGNHQTPLYDETNRYNTEKINYYIEQNFQGKTYPISENLTNLVSYVRLTDMLDFTRKDFNKQISLSKKKNTASIESKWELVRLGDETDLITKGTTPTSIGFQFLNQGINFVKIESISHTGQIDKKKFAYISEECNDKLSRSQLSKNDILFSIAGALGRTTIVTDEILPANTNQALAIIRLKQSSIFLMKFVYFILNSNLIQDQIEGLKVGIAQPNLSLAQINDFKIPLPPLEIQQQMIDKIEELEKNKNQFLKDEISMKDFEKLIKDKRVEIINSFIR